MTTQGLVSGRSSMTGLIRKNIHLIRYAIIGAGAVAVDLWVFLLAFNVADWSVLASQSVSVALAVLFSFTLNAFWNFGTTDRLILRFLSFCAVSFVGYLIGLAVIAAVESIIGNVNLGKVASLPVVFVAQYAINNRTSFRRERGHRE